TEVSIDGNRIVGRHRARPRPRQRSGTGLEPTPPASPRNPPRPARMKLGVLGSVLAGLAVAAGAVGAHALRGRVDPAALGTFETAVRCQLVHGLALLFASERAMRQASATARYAAIAFVAGIVLFSGSLYALALGAPRAVGFITPLGGLAFLAGWALLAVSYRTG